MRFASRPEREVSDPIQELFEAIREECSAGVWSRGVELARSEAVDEISDEDGEVCLRVATRGGLICPTVRLYPDDAEWDCECAGREGVCDHVAAAVIALRRARRDGGRVQAAGAAAGRIAYRLARQAGDLAFERVVVSGAGEQPLTTTLTAITSGRVDGPRFAAAAEDIEVERALGTRLRGALPPGLWPSVLAALSRCADVRLDGEPVTARAERVGWVARLTDQGDGFRLTASRDPRIEEVFSSGVALREGSLCLMGESNLTGREREELTRGRFFEPGQAAELVTEILPSLEGRIALRIETRRLPRTASETPRIVVQVERDGDALSVLPTLVYGDPPLARIDAGRLVPLGGTVPLRDEAAERALVRGLQGELELLPGRRLRVQGEEAVELAERLVRFRGEIRGDAHLGFRLCAALSPRFSATERGFDLRFEVPAAEDAAGLPRWAEPARVLRAWREGESVVPLEGGGFAPLPADWLTRYGARVEDLLAARDARGELATAALPDLARLCEALDEPVPEACAALRARLERLAGATSESLPAAALPEDLGAELRSYQRRGVDWLCALGDAGLGALLADDMGLGKTLQALCALRGRTLVVAPTSVLQNWRDETARFRPGLRCATYHGSGRRLEPDADVTLTSYALLRLDGERLAEVEWDTLVLDEAQAIKNPDSQVARAAYALRARFRIALSGTPVENRLDELWSQLHFLNPGLLGGRRDFEERYARPIAAGDGEVAEHLRARTRPFVLRRLKREVAPELPPRTEVVLRAELDAAEREIYDAIRAATRKEVLARLSAGGGVLQALEALLRLRQAACHPSLVPGQSADTSSKLELLLETLDESLADGHKCLVFSQWTSLLDLLEPRLAAAGFAFERLDGSTRDRAGPVRRFQHGDGASLMLLSLKAGGLGLNLTAADSVFILDPWWNPAAEDQAADRAHRIGQDRPVFVYRLVAQDTVEERILALQAQKRGLAEAALGAPGEGGGPAGLRREDLLALLE